MNKKAEEHMSKIAGEFCTWLRGLPGEDRSVNQVSEQHLRSLFDSGHGKSGGTIEVANESEEDVEEEADISDTKPSKSITLQANVPTLLKQSKLKGINLVTKIVTIFGHTLFFWADTRYEIS